MKKMAYLSERKRFTYGIAHLVVYATAFGNLNIPEDYVVEDGFALGEFVAEVREKYEKGQLSKKEVERLEAAGLAMDKGLQDWEIMYRMAAAFVETHGVLPEADYRTKENVLLGAWVRRQQVVYEALTEGQQRKLNRIGIGR